MGVIVGEGERGQETGGVKTGREKFWVWQEGGRPPATANGGGTHCGIGWVGEQRAADRP